MPVTKTAKRALRASKRKKNINTQILGKLEVAIRAAKKARTAQKIAKVFSLADRASKKGLIHKNKAARIKHSLAKLLSKQKGSKASPSKGKTQKRK